MHEQLLRLAWALPLVIALGVGALLLLKRHGIGLANQGSIAEQPIALSRTEISTHTAVIVVRHGTQEWLVFESSRSLDVQPRSSPQGVGLPSIRRV